MYGENMANMANMANMPNMTSPYGYEPCGYGYPSYPVAGVGNNNCCGFAIIVVLFILLIIIGATCHGKY